VSEPNPRKVLRSYRIVFDRRWRLFRIQGWRIPLPGGIELRLIGYWLTCLALSALLGRLPLLGALVSLVPPSLRLLALPLAAAWLLCRWQIDGRPPHRALLGILLWRLRPGHLAALRRVPLEGEPLAPLGELAFAPDLTSPDLPHGRLRGPARLLLRYPAEVVAGRRWLLRQTGGPALHRGKSLEVPPGRTVVFEGERA
jgi:hypothetical protein